jgi:PAS domain S-box-containing protein
MVSFLLIALLICLAALLPLFYFYINERKKGEYLQSVLDVNGRCLDPSTMDKITLSKKQLETAFDAITDLICALDSDLRIRRVNKSYAAFVGIPIQSLLGKHCWEVFWKKTERCDHCPARMSFASGKPVLKRQVRMPDKDRPRYFTVATYPVFDDEGKTRNVIEHLRDSTEEKVILEQLIRSEKLASIGTMTAGIAHELINPLSGISGTAANMLQMPDKYGLNGRGASRITTILDSSAKASTIVKDLLHLSRTEDGTSTITDVNDIVIKGVDAVRLKGFPPVDHKINLGNGLPRVLCDPSKIQQVVINLMTNAIQSVLEKKSCLARERRLFSGLILVATHDHDDMVQIDVSDNGSGVKEDIKNKIFDPFFTTRPPGEGTGLGLSICQKIIDEHQGRIFFESTESRTTFSILLPSYTKEGVREVVF